ncbi:hypothetical protein DVH24_002265 [Malus domestica]|uniref:DUF4283 domain-containing protein n=1 Tax=Malus domestica TaxID=3750 RepID=A0A498I9S7_MALDO|nr:hypothetical protein DVH24_002265 [Malus domestica]
MADFSESNPIYLSIWVKIPRIPMQYRELNILKTITKLIDDLVRFHDPCSQQQSSLLSRVLVVNGDKELPIFINYKGLFEVCSYCGRKTVLKYDYDINKLDVFGDKPNMLLEDFNDPKLTLGNLDNDLIVYFPQPPRAVPDGAHFGVSAKDSKRTLQEKEEKRMKVTMKMKSEGEGKAIGPSVGVGDGLGANN